MVSGALFFLSEPQWGTAVYDRCLFTSESVTEGHPDKVADAISDAVLDALLAEDPASRVACETLVTTGLAVIAGEITTNAYVHLPEVVRSTIARIGYTDAGFGFDSHTCAVMSTIDRQSPDMPVGVDTVVVSTQHSEDVSNAKLRKAIIADVIEASIPKELRDRKIKYHINPTGRFVIGGPQGDAGLTGRKIIVDTYGGMGRHGGGAFSGKDPSKVDRSACYAARWVAKNVVAAGLARRCEVQ